MYLTIIILPLIASVIAGLLGRKIGVRGAQLVTSISIFITVILALIAFYEVALSYSPVSISLFKWIDLDSILINWAFNFDSLTVSMLIPVLIVSSLVHIYSIGYMENDPHQQRFFSYLSLFTFFMTILVSADNYLVMFLGWEGVGISSYLLISFWFSRIEANKSAVAALLFNRVGDMFLTIGLFGLIFAVNNIDYAIVFPLIQQINNNLLAIIAICFLIGAMAKSAQIGLHIWLPSSMEGPTPVSALIHAATMVTAGVYLLMRSSILLESCPLVLLITLWVGAITTLFAGTIGLFQNDIKKVIAYSTCSQLGMLFIAVGLSQYNVALFHLVNHAFFKALLFLCAGSIIHAMNDEQDIRKLGGLVKILPFSYSMMVIGSLSLAAMPFLTGFYSKDLIIELAYGQYQFTGLIIYLISVISAIFTMTYSIRLLYFTFLSNANGSKIHYSNSHEGPLTMSIPLIILAIFSIIFGYYSKDFFVGIASNSLADSLYSHCNNVITIDSEFAIPQFYKLLPLFSSFIVAMIILFIYQYYNSLLLKLTMSNMGYSIYLFFNQRYWLELLVNNFLVNKGLSLGYNFNKQLDRGAIELIGPYGLNTGLSSISKLISKLDSGIITNYALFILLALISFIFFSKFELSGYVNLQVKPIIQQLTILYLVLLIL